MTANFTPPPMSTHSETETIKDALTAVWRVSDTIFPDEDGDPYRAIVWEDDTPDANIWEVCSGLTESEAQHIVDLHNRSLPAPPVRAPQNDDAAIDRYLEEYFSSRSREADARNALKAHLAALLSPSPVRAPLPEIDWGSLNLIRDACDAAFRGSIHDHVTLVGRDLWAVANAVRALSILALPPQPEQGA